jgi:hypothetical protein
MASHWNALLEVLLPELVPVAGTRIATTLVNRIRFFVPPLL